jgi:hypothetical protein
MRLLKRRRIGALAASLRRMARLTSRAAFFHLTRAVSSAH